MDKLICQILKRDILNHKKPALWVIAVAVIACTAAVLLMANAVKMLELPGAVSVISMDIEQFSERESLGAVTTADNGNIKNILSALTGARKTLRLSANDYPVQSNYLVIRLNLAEERRTLCLYNDGDAYYIEEPYIGVYKISIDANNAVYGIYAASSISENETLRIDSPDGTYSAEAYGTNTGITAAGLYPYEGLRLIRKWDKATLWSGDGCYKAEFLWSSDSKYLAVYQEARIYGECFIIDAASGKVIDLPDIDDISAQSDELLQPAVNRPDPFFKVVGWLDSTAVRVEYMWTAQEGGEQVSGTYEYDIVSSKIASNVSRISASG